MNSFPVADSGKDAVQRGFHSSARGLGPRSASPAVVSGGQTGCAAAIPVLSSWLLSQLDGYSVGRAHVTERVLSRKTLPLFL